MIKSLRVCSKNLAESGNPLNDMSYFRYTNLWSRFSPIRRDVVFHRELKNTCTDIK